jgi:exodeoxyribonuclease V beta subunit
MSFDVIASPLREHGQDLVPSPLLVEAGAGSGKTWTLAHLAVRFMLEDEVEPDQVLMVTFTRDAAREMKGRVRRRLEESLAFASQWSNDDSNLEPWQEHFTRRWDTPASQERDIRRLTSCLESLDGLHARTIHSFAAVHTITSGAHFSDEGRLWKQVFNETRARWSLTRPTEYAALTAAHENGASAHRRLKTLKTVAASLYDAGVRVGVENQSVVVVPNDTDLADVTSDAERLDLTLALLQKEFALDTVERFSQVLAQSGATSFADLVLALSQRLHDHSADAFVANMRDAFKVVMIDEFQDTDPLQWDIFRLLFADAPDSRLIVVGDPKQAIYRFRSGGVETFLDVREALDKAHADRAYLPTNRRSRPGLLEGFNRFFSGVDFNSVPRETSVTPVIGLEAPVATRSDAPSPVTSFSEVTAPFHLRVGPPEAAGEILDEVASYINRARAAGVALSSIAILTNSNARAIETHRFLTKCSIPSVVSSDQSVYDSDAAMQLGVLLAALAEPQNMSRVNALGATWFRRVDDTHVGMGVIVNELVRDFDHVGVPAIARFARTPNVLDVVLTSPDGERNITDLLQLVELLVAECRHVRSLPLLKEWLDEARTTLSLEESQANRRLETESAAVRVMTIHKSKGQEFDVVLLPFVSKEAERMASSNRPVVLKWVHDGRTVIDAGTDFAWGPVGAARERELISHAAAHAEQRRLLYVALTRAKECAVLWAPSPRNTPFERELHRLVFDRDLVEGGSIVRNRPYEEVFYTGVDKDLVTRTKTAPLAMARELLHDPATLAVFAIGDEIPKLPSDVGASVDGTLDIFVTAPAPVLAFEARRWSYSDVKKAREYSTDVEIYDLDDQDTSDTDGGLDEGDEATLDREVANGVRHVFGSLSGKELGVVIHAVLEDATGESEPAFSSIVEKAFGDAQIDLGSDASQAIIASSLERVWKRPLFGAYGDTSLSDYSKADFVAEMRFLMALGDEPDAQRLVRVVRTVRELDHGADGHSPFAEYLANEQGIVGQVTEGFVVGSLDAVVRTNDGRFRVLDYKTDQLAGATRPYAPPAMRRHVEAMHYPLQALFYSIALHRYLSGRMEGYDPAQHLGGVDFYFVRVVGDETAESGDGLFSWNLAPEVVVAASQALEGVTP